MIKQKYIDFADMFLSLLYNNTRSYFQEPFKDKYYNFIKSCVSEDKYNSIIEDLENIYDDKIIKNLITIHKLKFVSYKGNNIKIKTDFTRQEVYFMESRKITFKKEKNIECTMIIIDTDKGLKFNGFKGEYKNYFFSD